MNSIIKKTESLFYCRTPLQSLIIEKILSKSLDNITIVYQPTSVSGKHKYYFDKLSTNNKYFVPWNGNNFSYTLKSILLWYKIPFKIRKKKYDNLYISSIGDFSFSLFAANNESAILYTFDDGTFNLCKTTFFKWINNEKPIPRYLKYIFGGSQNQTIHKRIFKHFTIYQAKHVVCVECEIQEISLFNNKHAFYNNKNTNNVTIMLGSWFSDKNHQILHDNVINSKKIDVFIPHPADISSFMIKEWVTTYCDKDYKNMIAEDFVLMMIKNGLTPVVYGFDSSALINLCEIVQTINIKSILPGRIEVSSIIEKFPIPQITASIFMEE
jgi:beta-galactosamide-alpha-2,3-sialyltransferase